jgi:gas vesicle protein
MNSGKVLLGVLAGAAAGALAGVLFAPHKGKVTRKKIARQSEAFTEDVKEKINEMLDDLSDKFEQAKEDVSEYAEQKFHKTNTAKKEVTSV